MSINSEWILTQEAAEKLGVTTARIRQMVATGQLTGKKSGGKYRGQWQINASEVAKRVHQKGVSGTMRVKNRMTPSPIVATPKTNYNEALRLMQQNNIKNLPVVNANGKLVGIVTQGDMLKAEPSSVTTLSMYEMASLLEKVTMDKIMSSPVLAIDKNCSITNAANFMLENDVECLPVVADEDLVGIITETDIFKNFVEVTGGGKPGTHIEVRLPDQVGTLAPFIQAITNAGSYIVSVAIAHDEGGDYGLLDVKERGGDPDKIRVELEKLGFVKDLKFRPSGQDKIIKLG
jgi:acetoin utilization protein AcuB